MKHNSSPSRIDQQKKHEKHPLEWRGYVKSFLSLREVLPPRMYQMLCDLINIDQSPARRPLNSNPDFFECGTDFLKSYYKWSMDAQKWNLVKLRDAGLIELTKKGCPPVRYVKINFNAIGKLIETAFEKLETNTTKPATKIKKKADEEVHSVGSETPHSGGEPTGHSVGAPTDPLYVSMGIEINHCPVSSEPASQSPPKTGPSEENNPSLGESSMFFADLHQPRIKPESITETDKLQAEKLETELRSRGLLSRKVKNSAWAREFALLRKTGISPEQIQGILDWFCRNCTKPFTPVVRCANTFRSKFDRLVAAQKRDSEPMKLKDTVKKGSEIAPNLDSDFEKILKTKVEKFCPLVGWNYAYRADVPEFIKTNLIHFEFLKKEFNKIKTENMTPVMSRCHEEFRKQFNIDAATFVWKFVEHTYDTTATWTEIRCPLRALALNFKNNHTRRWITNRVTTYSSLSEQNVQKYLETYLAGMGNP